MTTTEKRSWYVKVTLPDGREMRSPDFDSQEKAQAQAGVFRLDLVRLITRVDVCQRGTGRILAAWDRVDDARRWRRTI